MNLLRQWQKAVIDKKGCVKSQAVSWVGPMSPVLTKGSYSNMVLSSTGVVQSAQMSMCPSQLPLTCLMLLELRLVLLEMTCWWTNEGTVCQVDWYRGILGMRGTQCLEWEIYIEFWRMLPVSTAAWSSIAKRSYLSISAITNRYGDCDVRSEDVAWYYAAPGKWFPGDASVMICWTVSWWLSVCLLKNNECIAHTYVKEGRPADMYAAYRVVLSSSDSILYW
jgi:hypothetical protein